MRPIQEGLSVCSHCVGWKGLVRLRGVIDGNIIIRLGYGFYVKYEHYAFRAWHKYEWCVNVTPAIKISRKSPHTAHTFKIPKHSIFSSPQN